MNTLVSPALSIIMFLVCAGLKAQGYKEGYIVTNEGDTLAGLIMNKNTSPYRVFEKIKFKKNKEGDVEELAPDALKSFKIGEEHYLSKLTNAGPGPSVKKFLKIIEERYLRYYELEYTRPATANTTLTIDNIISYAILQRPGEKLEFIIQVNHMTFDFKKRMAEYLKDDPIVSRKIKKGIYTRNEIGKMVKEYNNHKTL